MLVESLEQFHFQVSLYIEFHIMRLLELKKILETVEIYSTNANSPTCASGSYLSGNVVSGGTPVYLSLR